MAGAIRVCVLAVLSVVPTMIAADASAQDCPEWFRWACPDSSNAAAGNSIRREKRLARTKATSSSETRRTTRQAKRTSARTAPTSGLQQTQGLGPARPAKTARDTRSGDQSGDRHLVRHGPQQGDDVLSDGQKEALFREFLEWQKGRRMNAEAAR